jgi:hypothetical protein
MENSSNLKNEFKFLFEKMIRESHLKILNNILLNNETLSLEYELNEKYNIKLEPCKLILENIKTLSENVNLEPTLSGNILIKSKPLPYYEKEFKKKVNEFYKCFIKFKKLDNKYQLRISSLFQFSEKVFEKCSNNCENLMLQGSSQSNVTSCVKDCFRFDELNRSMMISLLNDEYLKYIKEIDRL